jgi:hypothetical protein
MAIQPTSVLLGVAIAWAIPLVTRVFRPFAVEAAAVGMALADDVRRVIAEQIETIEDVVAEARARREEMLAGENEDLPLEHAVEEEEDAPAETIADTARPRRRANGAARRHPS